MIMDDIESFFFQARKLDLEFSFDFHILEMLTVLKYF